MWDSNAGRGPPRLVKESQGKCVSGLKYVCLSDLHLGADYSVLTWMDPDGSTSLVKPSSTLEAFGVALREYVAALSGPDLPVLILMGDVLDLGLSSTGAVVQALKLFIQALFPAHQPAVFSSQVLCIPGNHDHHLWRAAQDQYFLDKLDTTWDQKFIPDLPQHSHLFSQDLMNCNLLTQVMRKYPNLKDASVNICYPNLGLSSPGGERVIVLHHGHYIDAMYRALSLLNVQLRGPDSRPKTAAQLERENGPWIDFLWSGLGGSGAVARDITTLYETSRSALASHAFSQQLGQLLLTQLAKGFGVGAETEVTHGLTVTNLVKGLVDLTLVRSAELERDSYSTVLSATAIADLRWYLGGPVRRQLVDEGPAGAKADVDLSFIFGHTHKPFTGELSVTGYTRPVAVYNTGGWVMDQPTMAPTQGAAAILIDDAMNLGSLRLFNDSLNGTSPAVHVCGVGGFRDADNPLLETMNGALLATTGPWQAFTTEASAALTTHARVLLRNSLDAVIRS